MYFSVFFFLRPKSGHLLQKLLIVGVFVKLLFIFQLILYWFIRFLHLQFLIDLILGLLGPTKTVIGFSFCFEFMLRKFSCWGAGIFDCNYYLSFKYVYYFKGFFTMSDLILLSLVEQNFNKIRSPFS